MIIYIAGPISLGGSLAIPELVERNIWKFNDAAARLAGAGHAVLNPVSLSPQADWESYMRLTIPMVCQADLVSVLEGWEKSRGARLEVFIARELGIDVEDAVETLAGNLV